MQNWSNVVQDFNFTCCKNLSRQLLTSELYATGSTEVVRASEWYVTETDSVKLQNGKIQCDAFDKFSPTKSFLILISAVLVKQISKQNALWDCYAEIRIYVVPEVS